MQEIALESLQINPFTQIGSEWMLVTAGCQERGYNTMTASWGHLGHLWNRHTAIAYVRPQRYTKEFVDREPLYTLSFFSREYREKLTYLGTHSGRDEDKIARAGLTPVFLEGTTCFEEARLTLICRKLYRAPILEEGFLDQAVLDRNYPERDFHDLYVGEILKALVGADTPAQ